jgi:glutamate-1-semialdehyde 2,1-aminomutase
MTSAQSHKISDVIPGGTFGATKWPEGYNHVIDHGKGPRLWTTEGKVLIDYLLGSGPMVLGHAHPKVVAAIQEQAARGTQFYGMNDVAPALASRIVELVPCAEQVKFVSDGASATFYAMRFARAFTGRTLIMKFDGAYHGSHDYAMYGFQPDHRSNVPKLNSGSAGIPSEISKTMLVAPYNDLEAATSLAMANADNLAAIIVEPVQRSLMPKPGYLAGLRALCDRIGAILIFDEVVTGFRLSLGGAQQAFGVTPDLCSLGKIVGGGLPLAAVAGRRDILELSGNASKDDGKSVFIDGTLSGNPLAAAAGLATINVLVEEDGPAKLAKIGTKLKQGFEDCAKRLSIGLQVIGPPVFPDPIFDLKPVYDQPTYMAANRGAARQFGTEMLKHDIFLRVGAKFYVSITHDDDVLDTTCKAAYSAMQAVRDAGLVK